MASRRDRKRSASSIFEITFGVVLLVGLPLALLGPKDPNDKLDALVTVFVAALAAGLAVAFWRRRPTQRVGDRSPGPLDLAPDLWHYGGAQARPDTGKWSLELLKRVEWRRFEQICAGYFEVRGFRPSVTREGTDGGVDISLYAEGADKPTMLVQCKGWNVYTVGLNQLRELRGAMSDTAEHGAYVTSATFTEEAKLFASKNSIQLIDGAELLEKINTTLTLEQSADLLKLATEGDFLVPTCPSCGVKMTWRAVEKDRRQSWRCVNYPRCEHMFLGGGRQVV